MQNRTIVFLEDDETLRNYYCAVLEARGAAGDPTEAAIRQNVRRVVNNMRERSDPLLMQPQAEGKLKADTQVRGVSFSHTGEHLAIAAGDRDESTKALDIVRVADGSRVRSLPLREGGVNFLAWAPHAALLAFALDDSSAGRAPPPSAAPGHLAPPTEAGALRLLVAT